MDNKREYKNEYKQKNKRRKTANKEELLKEIEKLEFQVKRRGRTIGGFYWLVQELIKVSCDP
jgi:hypothetical protein